MRRIDSRKVLENVPAGGFGDFVQLDFGHLVHVVRPFLKIIDAVEMHKGLRIAHVETLRVLLLFWTFKLERRLFYILVYRGLIESRVHQPVGFVHVTNSQSRDIQLPDVLALIEDFALFLKEGVVERGDHLACLLLLLGVRLLAWIEVLVEFLHKVSLSGQFRIIDVTRSAFFVLDKNFIRFHLKKGLGSKYLVAHFVDFAVKVWIDFYLFF